MRTTKIALLAGISSLALHAAMPAVFAADMAVKAPPIPQPPSGTWTWWAEGGGVNLQRRSLCARIQRPTLRHQSRSLGLAGRRRFRLPLCRIGLARQRRLPLHGERLELGWQLRSCQLRSRPGPQCRGRKQFGQPKRERLGSGFHGWPRPSDRQSHAGQGWFACRRYLGPDERFGELGLCRRYAAAVHRSLYIRGQLSADQQMDRCWPACGHRRHGAAARRMVDRL